jgi:UDP-glucose 4-epimerase
MVRVGVTGASGFLGGALVPALAREGHELRLLDDRSGPLEAVHPEWPVAREDFRSPTGRRWLSDCDVVLHLAALSGVMLCAEEPQRTRAVNVEGTAALFRDLAERSIPVAFASSFAVVGVPDRLPITEETPPRPTHEYARQKAQGEEALRQVADAPGGPGGAILRMSNLYGRYRIGEKVLGKGNVLNLFAAQARTGTLLVNAPGTQRRDFIHLTDVVEHWRSVATFLRTPRARGRASVFNVASGESATVLELASRVQAAWARLHPGAEPLAVRVVPNPRGSIELLQPEFTVDRSRTERTLGVSCRRSLESSLDEILLG